MHRPLPMLALLASCTVAALGVPTSAEAARWEVRREVREGAREVQRERREAARELRACTTRDCARREIREGQREVAREKREARREVRRELRQDYYDNYYRGDGRWYRDGRYWDRLEYERRFYHRHDGDGSFLAGAIVGAAVVGVAAAIAEADE